MESDRVIITNGSDNSWTFPKNYLAKFSRFYQDLCFETKSEPSTLTIPNILSGIVPCFSDLEDVIIRYHLYENDLKPNPMIIDIVTFVEEDGKQLEDVLALASRLDMPDVITWLIFTNLMSSSNSKVAIKSLSDQFIRSCCFESKNFQPLMFVSLLLKKSNTIDIILFILKCKTEIVEAEKKFEGYKIYFLIDSYVGGHHMRVFEFRHHALLPINRAEKIGIS